MFLMSVRYISFLMAFATLPVNLPAPLSVK
jgi:hypothetical protein